MITIESFRNIVEDNDLINYGDTIIIGASGGPDSQLLIYLIKDLEKEYNLNIILAHLNHLHRSEAIYDENLVKQTAEHLDLKYYIKRESMDSHAKKLKISPEDAGRRLRYEFFNEIRNKYDRAKIAVAHNKDDQAETILMRIIRGTGIDGLVAMDYKRGHVIRPILSFRKKDILEYLESNNIKYAIDKTNLETDYTRNYIRHEIIPKITKTNPNFIENIFDLSELMRDDLSIINEKVDEVFDNILLSITKDYILFDRRKLENTNKAILSRIIRKSVVIIKGSLRDVSKRNIEEFLSLINLKTGRKIMVGDISFVKNYNDYYFGIINQKNKENQSSFLDFKKENIFDNIKIKMELVEKKEKKSRNISYFDYDKLSFPLSIRYRKNGDKFKPIGLNHNKKLKDYFIDEKIDRDIRDTVPIILSDDKIIWIVGYRESEEFKVSKDTKKILKIEVVDGN